MRKGIGNRDSLIDSRSEGSPEPVILSPMGSHDPYRPPNWRSLRLRAGLGGRRGEAAETEHAIALSEEQTIRRWEPEARLLAGQDDETIATACKVSPGAVAAYHHWFFDVRDRLQCSSAIGHAVLAPAEEIEPAPAGFLKRQAYFSGPIILDAVLRWWHHPPQVPAPDMILDQSTWADLSERWLIQVNYLVRQQSAIAVLLLRDSFLETVLKTLNQPQPPRLDTLRVLLGCLEEVGKSLTDRYASRPQNPNQVSDPMSPSLAQTK